MNGLYPKSEVPDPDRETHVLYRKVFMRVVLYLKAIYKKFPNEVDKISSELEKSLHGHNLEEGFQNIFQNIMQFLITTNYEVNFEKNILFEESF